MAYPYLDKNTVSIIRENQSSIRFLLDSGAFTAWKSGKPIALDDYCRFLDSLPIHPWRYFTLDVVGDAKATLHNYETMLKRGFSPIPIFTRGEDPSMLEDYYKTSDIIGIGGLVGTQGNKAFLNGIMRHVADRHVHWLGFTNAAFLRHYRPYSCDSSTWCAGEKFAEVPLYFDGLKSERIHKSKFNRRPQIRLLKEISSFGFDPNLFCKRAAWDGADAIAKYLAAQSIIRYQLRIQEKLNTLFFIAVLFSSQINRIIISYLRERDLQNARSKSTSHIVRRSRFDNMSVLGQT